MRASLVLTVILGALALLAPAAQAAAPRTVATCDAARVDKAAGVARTLSRCGRVDVSRGAERGARQALGRLSGALGVRRDTRDLTLMSTADTAAGARTRFQQYVKGVPVRNGQVTVALGKRGSVIHVGSSATAATKLDTRARVSRAEALLTARRRVPSGDDTVAAPTTTLVAEPSAKRGLELAWLVRLPVRNPRGDWNVVVSARTGEVLEAYDSIMRVDGTAATYSPNPVQMTNNLGLTDGGDADSAPLTAARQSLTLTDLNPGINTLRGRYADTVPGADLTDCPLPTAAQGAASNPSRTYNYTRSQDAFEEAATYLAVTRVQRKYEALGFNPIFSEPVPIIAHCNNVDNSFFSDGDGALHMGDGGVDDAEDSDVTVHEFGHATQAEQVPGWGPGSDTEQRAMGEGFGDVLAAYIYLQDGSPTYQSTRRFCVAEWDAVSYNAFSGPDDGSGCLRWVDGTNEGNGADIGAYGGSPTEEHDDGRFWSAAMTCVFNGMEPSLGTPQARDRLLTLVLAHHFDLTPTDEDTAFADSLAALRAEDDAIYNGQDIDVINDCGEQRLGKVAPADTTPPAVTGSLSPAAPDGANGWYRTAPTVRWNVSDRGSSRVETGCGDSTDPADTPLKVLTCTATSAGGTTSKQVSYKRDATPPALAATLSSTAPKVGDALTAAPNASDATSGVAAQGCGVPDTSSVGAKSVSCNATDAAGNQSAVTLNYTVGAKPETKLTFKITKVKVARNGNVSFRLRASRSVRVKITAKAGKVKFRSANKRLTAGRSLKVTLKLSKKARAAFQEKLRGGKRVRVKVTLKPTGFKRVTVPIRVRRR